MCKTVFLFCFFFFLNKQTIKNMIFLFNWKTVFPFLQPYWTLHYIQLSSRWSVSSFTYWLFSALIRLTWEYPQSQKSPICLFVCFLFFFAVCEAVFQIYDSSLLIWLLVDALQFSVNLAEVNLHILRKAVSVVIHSSAISVVKYINSSISVVRYTAGSSLCVEISFS